MAINFFKIFRVLISGQAIRSIISLAILVPVVTYYVEPSELGVFGLYQIFFLFIDTFSQLGASWVLGAFFYNVLLGDRKSMLSALMVLQVISGLATILVLWLIAPTLSIRFLSIDIFNFEYFHIVLLTALLLVWYPTVNTYLLYDNKPYHKTLLDTIRWGAEGISRILLLVFLSDKLLGLFISGLIGSFFTLIFVLVFIRDDFKMTFDVKWFRKILRIGLPAIPSTISSSFVEIVARLSTQNILSFEQLGYYTQSTMFRNSFMLVNSVFAKSISPLSLAFYSGESEYNTTFRRILLLWHDFLFVAGVIVVNYSKELVNLLTHGKYTSVYPLVSLWYLSLIALALNIPVSSFLQAKGKTKELMMSQIGGNLIAAALVIVCTYIFGIKGVVAALVVNSFVMFFIRYWISKKNGFNFNYSYLPALYLGFLILNMMIIESVGVYSRTVIVFCSIIIIIIKTVLDDNFKKIVNPI